MATKTKNKKKAPAAKIDGLGPKDLQKIRNAVRQVWHRSFPRKICVARSTDEKGFSVCEQCNKRNPKNTIDHIVPVGDLLNGGIKRMFCSSEGLQALCKKCHQAKTNRERKIKDFY